jgi:hypothetical protein
MTALGIIEAEKPRFCQMCGAFKELRPYGPNGEEVCFPCGMKDENAARQGFSRLVLGAKDTQP